ARFKLRVKAEISELDWICVALRGPGATGAESGSSPESCLAVPFSWGGVTGVDLLGAAAEFPPGVRRCGAASWESVRVEAGIPVMGAELDERTIAAEADLLERCVSFTKGCYTGQELVARLDARGNKVARRLRGLVFAAGGDRSPSGGAEVVVGEKVVGQLTSVAWSPGLSTTVALAYLHRSVDPPCPVVVRAKSAPDTWHAEARVLPIMG
ncbi:MAG TPA: glycine cleavage T C-terminal barrel domain-containing protein, partial [Acidimicrobiales bacterium]